MTTCGLHPHIDRETADACRINRLRSALTHCLGLLCESGNLNNYRNLSDQELGKAWVETAKEAAEVLDNTSQAPQP